MADLVTRSEWGARKRQDVTALPGTPSGVKVHYLAGKVDPRLVDDHDRCAGLVREVQRWHMDGNGWDDLGYTGLVCPHGQVFVGRGPGVLPAANGNGLNARHYALCCLLGDKGLVEPLPDMLTGLAAGIRWLRGHGAGHEIMGHRDGFATECPGDPLYRVVKDWQRHGLPGEGPAPSAPPFHRLLSYPPLMTGDDVRSWQARMVVRGWNLTVDGKFGPQSQAVARAFQAEKGLPVSGRVTRKTWEAAWTAKIT